MCGVSSVTKLSFFLFLMLIVGLSSSAMYKFSHQAGQECCIEEPIPSIRFRGEFTFTINRLKVVRRMNGQGIIEYVLRMEG